MQFPAWLQPINPSAKFPDDLYGILGTLLAWGVFHRAVDFAVKAKYLIPLPTPADDAAPAKSKSKAKKSGRRKSTGGGGGGRKNKRQQRARRDASSDSDTDGTSVQASSAAAAAAAAASGDSASATSSTSSSAATAFVDEVAQVQKLRKKFQLAGWRLMFFSTSFLLGAYTVSGEWWSFSPRNYFLDWPDHPMSPQLKRYYVTGVSGSIYVFLFTFLEKMSFKDKMIMIIHHITTFLLLAFSFYWGFHRIGTIVLTLHDIVDPIMEFAKMNLYTGRKDNADILFGVFAVVFIISRNIVYPFYVVSSVRYYAFFPDGSAMPSYYVHYGFEALLWTLEVLHIYWAYLIVRMAISAVFNKGVSDDVRGDDDEQE
ncbi:Ceramide synthase 5 [Polyrhizophydium stewartii]|uniref:Ceramide synthase 5 n=1 Tax=Polyrhizophydium stewartii TaxID=2732419 RepID=A0ABR4MZD5_9FUNG